MNDPRRWLDKPNEVISWEQSLLRSGKDLRLPVGTEDRAWNEFRALVGPLPGGGPNHSGPAHSGGSASSGTGTQSALTQTTSLGKLGLAHLAGAATQAGITKMTLTVAAVIAGGSMAALGIHLASRVDAHPAVSTASSQSTNGQLAQPALAARQNLPATSISAATPPHSPGDLPRTAHLDPAPLQVQTPPQQAQQSTDPVRDIGVAEPVGTAVMPNLEDKTASLGRFPSAENPRLSELRQEATLVAAAKNLMTSGQFPAALSLLTQISQRFPAGVLAPEREALTIEALAGAGAAESAQQRAALFLAHYPQSPLADKIRKFMRPQ